LLNKSSLHSKDEVSLGMLIFQVATKQKQSPNYKKLGLDLNTKSVESILEKTTKKDEELGLDEL